MYEFIMQLQLMGVMVNGLGSSELPLISIHPGTHLNTCVTRETSSGMQPRHFGAKSDISTRFQAHFHAKPTLYHRFTRKTLCCVRRNVCDSLVNVAKAITSNAITRFMECVRGRRRVAAIIIGMFRPTLLFTRQTCHIHIHVYKAHATAIGFTINSEPLINIHERRDLAHRLELQFASTIDHAVWQPR